MHYPYYSRVYFSRMLTDRKNLQELLQASCTLYVSQTDTPNFCKAYTRFGVVETDFPNFYKASTRFAHICVHLGML